MSRLPYVTVLVRSRRVPAGVCDVALLYLTPLGVITLPQRMIRYDDVLDDTQAQVIHAARDLARRAGLHLQVTDLAKENFLTRAVKWLARKGSTTPLVQLPGQVVGRLTDAPRLGTAGRSPAPHASISHAPTIAAASASQSVR